tara:strand:- start:1234 stop:1521 length:288 start_codon:yes stop_codon:yes gene_type:complete
MWHLHHQDFNEDCWLRSPANGQAVRLENPVQGQRRQEMYVELEQNMLAWAGLYADFVSAADARVFKAAEKTIPSQDQVEPPVHLVGKGGNIDIVA